MKKLSVVSKLIMGGAKHRMSGSMLGPRVPSPSSGPLLAPKIAAAAVSPAMQALAHPTITTNPAAVGKSMLGGLHGSNSGGPYSPGPQLLSHPTATNSPGWMSGLAGSDSAGPLSPSLYSLPHPTVAESPSMVALTTGSSPAIGVLALAPAWLTGLVGFPPLAASSVEPLRRTSQTSTGV